MTIMVLKLMTGEEIIADVTASDEGYLALKNACTIIARPDESTGQIRMGMMPFAHFATGTVRLYPHAILADYTPQDELYNQYNKVFGSGIQLATAADMPRGR